MFQTISVHFTHRVDTKDIKGLGCKKTPHKTITTMAKTTLLLDTITVLFLLFLHPQFLHSHTLLRRRSDITDDLQFTAKNNHDDDQQHISTQIITKLDSPSVANPNACTVQEDTLKQCYQNLESSTNTTVNTVQCTKCLYGNVNPGMHLISCNDGQSMEYCQTVQGCAQHNCPSECSEEFYSVLNCIWEAGGCKDVRVGDGLGVEGCGISEGEKKKGEKKEAAVHPYPARTAASTTTTTAATTASTKSSSKETKAADKQPNPCSECSTSNGGVRNNFCGNIHILSTQGDACQSQTECADRGLKCQVCTEIVNKDGYGGESIEENVGNGAYICVKEDEKSNATTTTTSTTTTATAAASSGSSKKKHKKKKKPSKGGYCHSRAVVLGNCVYSKDLSPDCIQCIQAGNPGTQDPTCEQIKQDQFCQNIATCAHEHCGTCAFEFYTGLNCALQKIDGCGRFSCEMVAPPPHPTEEVVGYSSSSLLSLSDGHASHDGDDYSLERFQDEVTMALFDMQEEKDEEEEAFDVVLSEA